MPSPIQHAIRFAPGNAIYAAGIFDELDQYELLVIADLVEAGARKIDLTPAERDVVEVYFENEEDPPIAAREILRRRIHAVSWL